MQLITGAWPDTLAEFIRATRQELLIASPWITGGVARLISQELASIGPVLVQVLARMDEPDFLCAASDLIAFQEHTYPANARVVFRALPLLHGKMLVSDRERVIVGSANLTDGGLYRNHEISILTESRDIGEACAQAFFELWAAGAEPPADYLTMIERRLQDAMPSVDEGDPEGPRQAARRPGRARTTASFRYIAPKGARAAKATLLKARLLPAPQVVASEDVPAAKEWLERRLKFLSAADRGSEATVSRLERLMYHADVGIRATAIDRAGRTGNRAFLPRIIALATNAAEPSAVRAAAAFSLGLLGSPEGFATALALVAEQGDVGRWARRACFLLLADVDSDSASALFLELAVTEPASVLLAARECSVGRGTIAERLTKALILEQQALGHWSEDELDLLVCMMSVTTDVLAAHRRKVDLGTVSRHAARALEVAPGDLSHGPFSPTLLQRLHQHGISDAGLEGLVGERWVSMQQAPEEARRRLLLSSGAPALIQYLDAVQG